MLAPFPEPAVNEIDAEPLPAVADNDVGAAGAAALQVDEHELFGCPFPQLLCDGPIAFTARTINLLVAPEVKPKARISHLSVGPVCAGLNAVKLELVGSNVGHVAAWKYS